MSLLEKLLGSRLVEDYEPETTSRWDESVVQQLAQDWLDNNIYDEEPLIGATLGPDHLN